LDLESKVITSDEEFAAAARSDDLLVTVLGRSLERAMPRLGLILAAIGAIVATIVVLAA
jgi:hypothetical protein